MKRQIQVGVTAEEYLELERAAEERHELIDGKIVAMPPGNREHSLITINIGGELSRAPFQAMRGPQLRHADPHRSDEPLYLNTVRLMRYHGILSWELRKEEPWRGQRSR